MEAPAAYAYAKRLQSGRLDAYLLYMLIALVAVIAVHRAGLTGGFESLGSA